LSKHSHKLNFLYGYIRRNEECVQEQREGNYTHAQYTGVKLFMQRRHHVCPVSYPYNGATWLMLSA